jgi:hypothetical protein
MFTKSSGIDPADRKIRNQQPRAGTTILALLEGVLWCMVLLLPVLWPIVER